MIHVPSAENCELPPPVREPGFGAQYATCEETCRFEYILVDLVDGPVWENRRDFERWLRETEECAPPSASSLLNVPAAPEIDP